MTPRTIPDTLPILTEIVDDAPLDLPTLTEVIEDGLAAAARPIAVPLSDEQCRMLADLLFPQLEAALRQAIGSRSETRWTAAMQQVQARLPDLIRSAAAHP